MTLRLLRLLACQLLLALACVAAWVPAQAADGIEISRAAIEASDDGYRLNTVYDFELNSGLRDALQHGVQLHFTTEIELVRPRWWWRDERAVSAKRTIRISYDVLTRQYYVTVVGSFQERFQTFEDAMFMVRRPTRWLIAPKGKLKPGEVYEVSLRMYMDREYLQKPLQVNALNDSDWRLTSSRKTFTYRAE
ncbi:MULTISPECIES: DUF4390 domain-containing protein [Massilia]|uniref:DUF4390 domain-containing protein n=2 Tax=Massilia timonae TaxID=47229 RepID=K9DV77_9BURK|nr:MULTISPECIES: DUF4390 domain-containing protein [Massilia]EKU81235.1 hypothetical protein HMPREF9710_03075 [Massilia timonae CCUG 45783]OIJ41345.1 hypothetical protein LO55_690 [Massilia timonae]QYG01076.1 DUF4390 domain-containing protein [Massilia sp. NP310]HAK92383.1 DUF4390 domain-containing protein [Massilia timonae]